MPTPDETPVVAVIDSGPRLARAALRCWEQGRAVLPLSPSWPDTEIDAVLDRMRVHAVVANGGEVFRQPDGLPAPLGTAAVVVTSGTAGEPKGVELSDEGMEVMARGYSAGLDAGRDDRWLACLPLHHVAGLAILSRAFLTGVPCTVHHGFDLERVARSPQDEGTTIVSLVPTMLRRLLDANAPLDQFRRVITGGAPCPPELRSRAESLGVTVVDAYGLSETWGGFALDGTPIAGAEVRVDTNNEILVRGAMVMHGYRLEPERTAEVLDPAGWLHTGDVGELLSDGRVRVVDRLKDLVITGGINVSPNEVEGVLATHPDIEDVCVTGLPDDDWGELVVAFVVPRGDARPTIEELRQFARTQLSAPKLPREVRIVDTIPRGSGGKPLRRVLRESA